MLLDGCKDKVFACEQDVQNAISETARENANAIFISKKLSMALPIQVVTSSWESLAEDRGNPITENSSIFVKKQQAIKSPLHMETCIKANYCTSVNVIATQMQHGPRN